MAFSAESKHGIAAIVDSWPVYALIVAGLGSLLLTQTAYQAARPMITLPVIAAVTPSASVAIGIGFLGEITQMGAGRAIAAGFIAVGTGAALVVLARSAPAQSAHPAAAGVSRQVRLEAHPASVAQHAESSALARASESPLTV
jgi:hypothetical protein